MLLGSIKDRFLQIGYAAEDVNHVRRHHEVRTSKPMSDRGKFCGPLTIPSSPNTQLVQCGSELNRFFDPESTRPGTNAYYVKEEKIIACAGNSS